MRNLEQLIEYLVTLGLMPTADNLAEALWLAVHLSEDSTLASSTQEAVAGRSPPMSEQEPTLFPKAQIEPSDTTKWPQQPLPQARLPEENSPEETKSVGALPVRLRAGSALPDAFALGRALRPLRRRIPSRQQSLLDEQATVRRRAETRVWLPVRHPAPERWLDVALVVDVGVSMAVWRQTITDLTLLLIRSGAFRDLRLWSLYTTSGSVRLQAGLRWEPSTSQSRSPRELLEPTGRRLILIVSDCTASAWRTGELIRDYITLWAAHHLTSIVQMFPRDFWVRTALENGQLVRLRALVPAVANRRLDLEAPSGRGKLVSYRLAQDEIAVPVLTLESAAVGSWARMVTAAPDAWTVGLVLHPESRRPQINSVEANPSVLVANFDATASPEARRLAGNLAAIAPLNLPLMRLVQQATEKAPTQLQLAEVLLSGLIRRVSAASKSVDSEEIQYDFLPGVSELLLSGVTQRDVLQVRVLLCEHLQQSDNPTTFQALVADPRLVSHLRANMDDRSFAQLDASVLRKLGGEFAHLAGVDNDFDPNILPSQQSNPQVTEEADPIVLSSDVDRDEQDLSLRAEDDIQFATLVGLDDLIAKQHQLELDDTFPKRLEEVVLRNWKQSIDSSAASWPKATIGVVEDNKPRELRFENRYDGAHCLIAGSTGSGKTELLTTLVIGMALNYHPQMLNFIFVDYKGGNEFDSFTALPHCVGLIKEVHNLPLLFSAFSDIITERQRLLQNNNTNSIMDYHRVNSIHGTRSPLPYLFILINQFDELSHFHPQYIDQIRPLLRMGRSMGIHVVLALQQFSSPMRPLKRNFSLRICFRVNDKGTSEELLNGSDIAFSQTFTFMPGRGYISVGSKRAVQPEILQVASTSSAVSYAGKGERTFYDVAIRVIQDQYHEERPRIEGISNLAKMPQSEAAEVVDTGIEIAVDFEQLEDIAIRFVHQRENVNRMLEKLSSKLEVLENGSWLGAGSEAFFGEMRDTVIPKYERLINALSTAEQTTRRIIEANRNAESQASAVFRDV